MPGDYHDAIVLAALAAGTLSLWLLLLLAVAVATRPSRPEAGPPTMELGTESPAVVNLITNGWQVGHEAVPATLLDLAARGYVSIEQTEPERYVVQLEPRAEGEGKLVAYDRQVLDHVRRLAGSTDSVPGEALTTGPDDRSRDWWSRFDKNVRTHARQLGLSRPRFAPGHLAALSVLAFIPILFVIAALVSLPTRIGADGEDANDTLWPMGLTMLGITCIPFMLRGERDTPAGDAAARRWLGVREHLHDDAVFGDLPPAAVAVWDRYLAYGAALGVAIGAVRALPLGAESETEAWSLFGGRWHVVRISYRRWYPPGWGHHPVWVAVKGVFWGALAFVGLVVLLPWVLEVRADGVAEVPEQARGLIAFLTGGSLAIAAAITGIVLLRSIVMIALAVPDAFSTRTYTGRVVRVRPRWKTADIVAIDDGTAPRVQAYRRSFRLPPVKQGADVDVTVTPRLGYIRAIRVT